MCSISRPGRSPTSWKAPSSRWPARSNAGEPPPAPNSPEEQELLGRFVRAFEASDVDALVALMTEDVWMRMPPVPLEYQGRELTGRFLGTIAFRLGRRYRLVPT